MFFQRCMFFQNFARPFNPRFLGPGSSVRRQRLGPSGRFFHAALACAGRPLAFCCAAGKGEPALARLCAFLFHLLGFPFRVPRLTLACCACFPGLPAGIPGISAPGHSRGCKAATRSRFPCASRPKPGRGLFHVPGHFVFMSKKFVAPGQLCRGVRFIKSVSGIGGKFPFRHCSDSRSSVDWRGQRPRHGAVAALVDGLDGASGWHVAGVPGDWTVETKRPGRRWPGHGAWLSGCCRWQRGCCSGREGKISASYPCR